jgi:endonuclease/exonuclease/phosphatase (EEP) superfamily protein YafD
MIKSMKWATIAAAVLAIAGCFGAWSALSDSLAQFRHVFVAASSAGAVAMFLAGKRAVAIAALAAGVASTTISAPHLPFMGPSTDGTGAIKIVQFNLKIHNAREDEAARWLIAENPDVVMLQEYLDETHPSFRALATTLPFSVNCTSTKLGEVSVRTKFPVLQQGCTPGDGLAWVQVDVKGKPVTFASLHLHWPWPFRQWQQLASLEAKLADLPAPVVLTGDFNAAPWSEAVKTVERLVRAKAIGGYRTTLWPDIFHNGINIPTLPIDHVLLPQEMTVKSITVGPTIGSDHLPVIVTMDMKPP